MLKGRACIPSKGIPAVLDMYNPWQATYDQSVTSTVAT